jgi:adenine-specific DNA-methyltransferase
MPTLDWIGKKAVVNHHRDVPYRLIHCDKDKSVGDPDAGNLLVQGDNLEALKALLPYYAGKVKCIYIDPPYNTGNEAWVYNDNVNSPEIKAWLGSVVGKEAEDLSRHDKWLCMMYPRLRLLKEFMSDDGVLFASCDGHELASLIHLGKEVFGVKEPSVIAVVNNLKGRNDKANIAQCHEYLIMFPRDGFIAAEIPLSELQRKTFKNVDDKGAKFAWRDLRKRGGADTRELRQNLFYPIYRLSDGTLTLVEPTNALVYDKIVPMKSDGDEGCWRWGSNRAKKYLPWLSASYVRKTERWNVNYRVYLHPEQDPVIDDEPEEEDDFEDSGEPIERGTKAKSFWWGAEFSTDRAGKHLKKLVGKKQFDYPKPVDLVRRIVGMSSGNGNCLFLDSFAGSGTTGEAVLKANIDEGENHKFILIEIDKEIAREVTSARLSKVVGEVGSGFRFCTLGEPLFDADGNVSPAVTYPDLAAHVFFCETGSPIPRRAEEATALIGTFQGRAIYLLHNAEAVGVASANAGNVLTGGILDALPLPEPGFTGARIVYGEGCTVPDERLSRLGVTFKQIPYQIEGL